MPYKINSPTSFSFKKIIIKDEDFMISFKCYVGKYGEFVMPYKINSPISFKLRDNFVTSFQEGIALIRCKCEDGMDCHLIDHNGKVLYLFSRDEAYFGFGYQEGLAGLVNITENEDRWYFVDINGKNIFGKFFDHINPFHEGMAIVTDNDKSYFIDNNGNSLHITDCHTS
jgi:hypothetical protein